MGRRRLRTSAAAVGVPLLALAAAACSRSHAQPAAAAEACRATIQFTGSANECPTAPLNFRISVPGCMHSSGAFGFDYKVVNQIRKAAVSGSGTWHRDERQWEQTERVALGCDDEIDDVANVHATACTCKDLHP